MIAIPPLSQIPVKTWPAPHFSRAEMGCRHCGEVYIWPEFLARLEHMRTLIGAPLQVLSGHRCSLHNARVGGAPFSQHLKLAADIALAGHDRAALLHAAKQAGFTGFGYYRNFLHIDLGRPRSWWPNETVRQLWQV